MKRIVESLTPPENKYVMWLDVSGKVKQLKTYINGEWVIVNDDTENNKEIVKTVLESIDKDFESYIKKEDADSKYVQQEVLDRDYVKSEYATKTYATIRELNNLSTSLDSDYVKKTYADSNYVIKNTLDGYITKFYADNTYVTKSTLENYVTITDADTKYVSTETLDNYVTIDTANSTYATQTALAGKVAQETYDAKMTAIDSKLKTLENKTIDVDAELKDSVNPVQNRAVNAAVLNLNTEIGKKADTTALNSAVGRITALENNGATGVTVIESGEGNGIASIKNVGKNIIATKATFVTSLTGYVTTDTLNTELAKKSDVGHTHTQYAETSALDNYALKSALDRKVDAVVGKGLSTEDFTSAEKTKLGGIAEGATRIIVDDTINDSINAIQNRAVKKAVDDLNTAIGKKANSTDLNAATGKITTLETNAATILSVTGEGNGISSISKSGNTITATKGNFLTSAAGLATKNDILPDTLASKGMATKTWVNEQGFATGTIPTNVSQLTNDSGFLTNTALNGYVNEVQPDGTQSGNGIANITKEGKVLKVTKSTFLTEHQSLGGYVNNVNVTEVANGNGIASIAKNGKDINVTQGAFLTAIDGIIAEIGEAVAGKGVTDISIRGNKLVKKTGTFVTPATLGDAIDNYASNKGYLTENNLNEKLKETVTIKLVSDKSASDTNLNGAKVTVKSGDTTVSTQTWQGTPINVKVPCDKEVTIEAAVVKMYTKPKALVYVPSPLYNREVTFTYKALKLGVFFIDINDNLINMDSWNSDMQQTTVGVALITGRVAIVIPAGSKYPLLWSEQTQLVEGVTTVTNYTDALEDFKGKANTEAIVKALGQNAPAAYYCSNYTFKNGRKGHLMSAGEAQEMCLNIDKLAQMLNYIDSSSTNFEIGYKYWTSTQQNSSFVWMVDDDQNITINNKTYTGPYTVPIYSLYD